MAAPESCLGSQFIVAGLVRRYQGEGFQSLSPHDCSSSSPLVSIGGFFGLWESE